MAHSEQGDAARLLTYDPDVRCLAIDLGLKRTGFAVGDDVTGIVQPLHVVELPDQQRLLSAVARLVREHESEAIVLGLPLNMDDSEGEPARQTRAFGEKVHQHTTLPVYYQDERLTSFTADQQMARTGRTHKQKARRRDALAAAQILRDYFDRAR